jgi:hypothetical protein
VQHALLQGAYARQSFFFNALPEPPPNRGIGVGAEIKSVLTENPLQQQLDLDSLEIGLERLPVGLGVWGGNYGYR